MHGSKKGMTAKSVVPIRQRSYKWAEFKVSDYLFDAPREVLEGLATALFSRISGSEEEGYSDEMCEWITSSDFVKYKQPIYLRRCRNITRSTEGEYKDLEESRNRLIEAGLIDDDKNVVVSWTKESGIRKVGHCSVLMKVITMSKSLDTDLVPDYVLDYCLYHEYCHILIGFDPTAKRHGTDFVEMEARFPQQAEAEEWLRRLGMYL